MKTQASYDIRMRGEAYLMMLCLNSKNKEQGYPLVQYLFNSYYFKKYKKRLVVWNLKNKSN